VVEFISGINLTKIGAVEIKSAPVLMSNSLEFTHAWNDLKGLIHTPPSLSENRGISY